MILGLIIAFLITFVVTIAVALVIIIAYHETQYQMHVGYSIAPPPRRFRSYIERDIEQQRLAQQAKGQKPRHIHYHK